MLTRRRLLEGPELARSELIFPGPETLATATDLRPLRPDEERKVTEAFQQVIGA